VNREARICSGLSFERRAMLRFYFFGYPHPGPQMPEFVPPIGFAKEPD